MRPHRVVLLSVVLMVTAACRSESPSNQGAREAEHRYAVLRDDAWRLQEAVDPPADDDGVTSVERPALDWYAEYVPANSSSGGTLRLSGHRATFHHARSELEELGFDLDEVDVDNWTGVGGSTAEKGSRPTLLLLDHGSSSLTLLSYDLELDALTQLAAHVRSVDETACTGAGGLFADRRTADAEQVIASSSAVRRPSGAPAAEALESGTSVRPFLCHAVS